MTTDKKLFVKEVTRTEYDHFQRFYVQSFRDHFERGELTVLRETPQ